MINKNHEDYLKYKEAFDILVAKEKNEIQNVKPFRLLILGIKIAPYKNVKCLIE